MLLTNIHLKKSIIIFLYIAFFSWSAASETVTNEGDTLVPLALQGYDAISYFRSDKALKGNNNYQTLYKGKRYVFVSQENQNMFSAHPEQFLPQFGGYCAHTATLQNPVIGDPAIYLVDQGKLFLFSSVDAKNNWPVEVHKDNAGLVPLALQGYDVTTYFSENQSSKGKEAYQAVYNGKRYHFVNQQNQQKFAANPEKFLPQFGGYCSHSVSQKTPIEGDPSIFVVDKGDLFLFSSSEAKNVWTKQPAKTLSDARQYWTFEATKRNNEIAAKNRWKKESKVKLFTF